MSATSECFYSFSVTAAGAIKTFGSAVTPSSLRTLTSGSLDLCRRQVIAAETKKTVWDYTVGLNFQVLGLRILGPSATSGEGYLEVGFYIDTPTSTTDDTPSGARPRWRTFALSCGEPLVINTQNTLLDPTLANDSTDTSGYPTLWNASTDGTRLAAKIYKVAVWNRSEDPVDSLEVIVLY